LDGAHDAFFEVGAVLLHYDDGFLEGVFFVDLFLELAGDECVCYVSLGRGVRIRRREGEGGAYGSLLAVTPIGVFLKTEMLVARSLMSFADSSRSLATLAASLPVSFWTFYIEIRDDSYIRCLTRRTLI
jgi:hypothetical protein